MISLAQEFLNKPPIPHDERPTGCVRCPFKGLRVGSRGPVDSPFVIVGESPGANELWKGYPFVGASGTMLEQVLLDVGHTDQDPSPYITNAMQCLPRQKDENIVDQCAQACHQRLIGEIGKYPRKVILALGNAAIRSLTNNYGLKITKERGKLFKSPLAEMGIVAATHPAYLMRNGTAFIPWKKDLEYAVSLLKGVDTKDGRWAPPQWSIVQGREDLADLVNRLKDASHIAGDLETGGHASDGTSFGLDWQRGHIVMLGITSNLSRGGHVDIIPGEVIWDNEDLMHELLGNKAEWIWQNGKFDVKWFRHEGITEARVDHDTMLLSYCLNENKGHDLDTIAWEWIGAPQHKKMLDDWFDARRIKRANKDYALLPKDLLYKYAAYDISKTYHVFWALHGAVMADSHSAKQYSRIMIGASEFLTQIEMKGLKLDMGRVNENLIYFEEALKSPAAAIQEYATQYLGHTINIASWQQLDKLLYGAMKLGSTGAGTDEDSLIKIQRKFPEAKIVDHLMSWRKLSKANSTYAKNAHKWSGTDGRVHITFKLHTTTTGRLSSGDPTNLQNWPRDPRLRGSFVAEDGCIYISVDLNQAELRCLALMSGDPTLLDIYRKNEVSIHHITSVAMFGEKYTDDNKMAAKAVNFGIVYGRTAPSLAEEFNIPMREAEEYIRIWMGRFPVAAKFIEFCRQAPSQQRTLITAFGRKKRWGAISFDNQRNSENEAANFPHQSTAHDITLNSGIECQPIIRQVWGAEYVNEIHDDLMSEMTNDPSMYGPMIAYQQAVMQRTPRDWGLTLVPFIAEAKVGTRWGAKRNAKEGGETREDVLSQYMTDYKPTPEDIECMHQIMFDRYGTRVSEWG